MQLANFDIDGFLRDYWQKKPLLIRNPWQSWSNPLDPDELAGLACEAEVESRLIVQTPDSWQAEHGPFPEPRFGALCKQPWTLLVQAVDHHAEQVAAIIEPFRFIPNWRIDDVMVSYATNGGGVGPHYDQYDVFLIQGLGRRRWQIGATCDDTTELLPHDDLRLLAMFEPIDEWILEPGDILYVPPRVAHNGVAIGDHCMTYSIGFRAPSRSELIEHYCDDLLEEMPDGDRYADPNLMPQSNPGEISPAAITALHALVTERLDDRAAFARWFGQYSSARKYPEVDWHLEEPITSKELRGLLRSNAPLVRNPASRFSFIRGQLGSLQLFVDGLCFACGDECAEFAERLCARDRNPVDQHLAKSDAVVSLLLALINQGSLAFEPDD